jgi:hypothetical protein
MNNPISTQFAPSEQTISRHQHIVLAALRLGPVDTITFRERWGIASAAPRIWELRHKLKLPISTRRVKVRDEHGRMHTVAEYRFVNEVEA